MGQSKTIDLIQIKIKMPNPSHEPPASFKTPTQDLEDMDVLCIFKFKMENHNLEHGCIKDQYNDKIQIKIPNPSQEMPTSSKAKN